MNLAIATWNHATDVDSPRDNQITALRQILGAPFVPAVILLFSLGWCMESPRYYMQPNTPHRNPSRALEILLNARQTTVSRKQSTHEAFVTLIVHSSKHFETSTWSTSPSSWTSIGIVQPRLKGRGSFQRRLASHMRAASNQVCCIRSGNIVSFLHRRSSRMLS